MPLSSAPDQWHARQKEGLGLLRAYVEGLEDQADRMVQAFNAAPGFADQLPNLQRKSGLMTIYAVFESELESLCDSLQRHKRLPLGVGDLRSRGMERSALYLEKVAGVAAAREGQAWVELGRIREIRNLIIHADGRVPGHKPDLITYLSSGGYFLGEPSIQGRDFIRLRRGFLQHVLDVWEAYARGLGLDEIRAVRPE